MKNLKNMLRPYLTEVELGLLWGGTPDSRYSKLKRLLAQGKLLHIRRGLYWVNSETPHPYALAQFVYGPSYISLESALSFYQLIPEAVYTTTSVTVKRAKEFQTPLGVFSYQHLPLENFLMEVMLVKQNGHSFFMAKPWKAICDYVYCYRKDWTGIAPLRESLRIEPDDLPMICEEDIDKLNQYYHHSRIHQFLKGVLRDLSKA